MQEEASVFPPNKVPQQLFRLPSAAFDVDRPQYGNDVFEQELGIVRPTLLQSLAAGAWDMATPAVFFLGLWVQEAEDLKLAANPFARPRHKGFVAIELLRCHLAILRKAVRPDSKGIQLVAIDVAPHC